MFIVVAKKKEKGLFKKIMLLSKIRAELINDSIAKDICKENSVDKEFLKGVPITFDDIDVAAKTVDSEIILNTKLIKKPFDVIMRYVIHELVHAIQHCETNGKSSKQDKSETCVVIALPVIVVAPVAFLLYTLKFATSVDSSASLYFTYKASELRFNPPPDLSKL